VDVLVERRGGGRIYGRSECGCVDAMCNKWATGGRIMRNDSEWMSVVLGMLDFMEFHGRWDSDCMGFGWA